MIEEEACKMHLARQMRDFHLDISSPDLQQCFQEAVEADHDLWPAAQAHAASATVQLLACNISVATESSWPFLTEREVSFPSTKNCVLAGEIIGMKDFTAGGKRRNRSAMPAQPL